jgi:hypothetical protein
MGKSISRISIILKVEGLGEAKGELIRHLSPRTVDTISRILPIEGRAALWKNEVYLEVPIRMGEEKPKNSVQKGALAYWPMGKAFCIFHSDAQPYSSVNIIGQITENLEIFSKIKSGTKIRVERI